MTPTTDPTPSSVPVTIQSPDYTGPDRRVIPMSVSSGSTVNKALDFLTKYGPLAGIALYLVYILATNVSGGQADTKAAVAASDAKLTMQTQMLGEHVKTTETISETLKSILIINRVQCIQTAKDEAGRAACAKQ